ncbi:MAG TPA: hypothetical protein VK191_09720 [Symbiobacteriaceae bacterium]|nr:hypothetical protein [Symbiobacteriaceae bacterium]
MRLRLTLLVALILVGCSRAGERLTPAPAVPAPVTQEKGEVEKPPSDQPPPADQPPSDQPCTAVLVGVHPAIGLDWVQTDRGPCWIQWQQKATESYLSVSWSKPESESWVLPELTVPIDGGRYQGLLGYERREKTGAAFWGPTAWSLEVTGTRGRVTITCGMQMAPDLEQGKARQIEVDARCPELLRQTWVGDLGEPVVPPMAIAAPEVAQDIWLISPAELLLGNTGAGGHFTLHAPTRSLQVSPTGDHALLFVIDKSRMKTTYPVWIEVLDRTTGEQWRLTEQSDWWTADWLPDGRVVLLGSTHAWLSDAAVRHLQDLGETGGVIGHAFDGRQQVAWASRYRPPFHDPTTEFVVRVLNLGTGKLTEYPERYHTRVSPKAGAPLALSPDGDRLALVDKAGEKGALVLLSLATREAVRVEVDPSADVVGWDRRGLWVRYQVGETWQVGRFDMQGREVERMADFWPQISPDGKWSTTVRSTEPTATEGMKAQPGLVNLETGEVHWAYLTGYYPSGWMPNGNLVLLQQPTY